MATFYDKMVHLVGEGGWDLAKLPRGIVIEWHRAGDPPSVASVEAVTDADADATAAENEAKRTIDGMLAYKAIADVIADQIPGKTRTEIRQEIRARCKELL